MTYSFDTEIAAEFGVSEAIMIQNFMFWINKNAANDKHFHEGKYWTYNSVEAFARLFPFWNAAQVRHTIKNLIEKGVLIKGNYNTSQRDRTCWYAFTDSFCNKYNFHLIKLTNGVCKNAKCNNNIIDDITDINTDNKPNNIPEKRGTTENLCLFANSKFAKFEDFAAQFPAPEYQGIDMYYYWQVIMDWSNAGGNKKRDWIATARNWIRSDVEKGKLHRKPQNGVSLSPDAINYLNMCGGLFDE